MSLSIEEKKVIKLLKGDPVDANSNLNYITDEMANNPEFVTSALKVLTAAPRSIHSSVTLSKFLHNNFSDSLKNNDDFMKEVISFCPSALWCASNKLRSDPKVVMGAVKDYPPAFIYSLGDIRTKLSSDKKVVIEAVKIEWSVFKYVSEELRSDKEVVLAAVKNGMHALEYASANLQSDPDIVSMGFMADKDDWTRAMWYFRHIVPRSADQQLRKDPRLARYFEMNDILDNLRAKKIKLDEIDEKYFADSTFYNQVVNIMEDLINNRFEELTKGVSEQEILDQKLQKTLEKRIAQMERKLKSKRNLVVFKQKVKKVLHKDEISELDKDLGGIEV